MDVLIVDDSSTMLMYLQRLLVKEYAADVVTNRDPVQALLEAGTHAFDLVLVDQNMPQMDGVAFIRALRAIPHYAQVPIAMITGEAEVSLRLAALEAGATDFLDKFADRIELTVRLRNLIMLARAVRRLDDEASSIAGELERAMRQLREREAEVIFRLALAVEYRDNDTGDHTWRVARYTQIMAETLGLDPDYSWRLYLAAPLHDVGKVAVPDGILLKKGRLDEAEFAVVKNHPVVGKRILNGSDSDLIQLAAEIAEAHHERWDGTGYPYGLGGMEIPLSARIVAVADVFDALTTARPYKDAMSFEEARRCIESERGRHFDPDCVDAFIAAWDRVQTVRAARGGEILAGLVRGTEPWARVPEMRREIAFASE
ncbi:HD-GYP domain-containing protein [Methylobacterium komagatae]